MFRSRFALPLAFILFAAAPLPADEPATQPSVKDQVAALIKQLDSDSYQDREAAADAGAKLPGEALPLLDAAAARTDLTPEVRVRLEAIAKAVKQSAGRKARYQTCLEFVRSRLNADYDRAGSKSPKWDATVRELFEISAHKSADQIDEVDNQTDVEPLLARLRMAGCDDPLIKSLDVRHSLPPYRPADLLAMSDAMEASQYSAASKMTVLAWMADNYVPSADDKKSPTPTDFLNRVIDLWPTVLNEDPQYPADLALEQLIWLPALADKLHLPRPKIWKKVDAALARALPAESLVRLNVKADFLVDFSTQMSGGKWARGVSGPQTYFASNEAAADAEKTLARCFELFPDDWHAPTKMVTVVLGRDYGPEARAKMELWFDRATKINPTCVAAHVAKMHYLSPRFNGGGAEEQITFGRECLAGQRFDSNLPLMVAEAHTAAAPPPPWASIVPNPYFAKDDVWADLKAAYEGYLAVHPQAWRARAKYANFAWGAGKWQQAADLYAQLKTGPEKFRTGELNRLIQLELPIRLKQAGPPVDPDIKYAAEQRKIQDLFQKLLVGEYERVGQKDPKWDKAVLAQLNAMVRLCSFNPDRNFSETDIALDSGKEAIDAGCTDPLVKAAYALCYDEYVAPKSGPFKSIPAALELAKSRYSKTTQMVFLVPAISYPLGDGKYENEQSRKESRAALAIALPIVFAAAHDREFTDEMIAGYACVTGDSALVTDREAGVFVCEELSSRLRDAGLERKAIEEFEAYNSLTNAWTLYPDPKHILNNFAPTDTAAYFAKAKEAQSRAENLWQAHPEERLAGQILMRNVSGTTRDKDVLDFWFRQTISTRPNDERSARFYFECLLPCTNSYEPMMRFAQQCAKTGDYRSQIPFLAVEYQDRVARYLPSGPPATQPSNEVLARDYVWQEIDDVYEAYLAKFPLDSDRRSEFASYACRAGRWSIAAEQFKLLGPHVRPKAFGSQQRLNACRKHAEELMGSGFLPTTQPAAN